jgi:DNA-binding transcriptional MerR regulator
MTNLLKPTQLANLLDVSEPTIRRWCLRFSEFLSSHATPTHGSRRRLTEQDVLVLRRVKALVDTGLSLDAIELRLRQEPDEPLPELPDLPAIAPETRDPWAALDDALRQIAGQNQRIAQLEDRLERLSQEIKTLKTGANR